MKDLGVKRMGKFKPHAWHHESLDWLFVILEDVGYVASPTKCPYIDILYHPHERNKVVGVKITSFSEITQR